MADVTLIFEEQPISLALTTATLINLVLDGGATYTAGTGISIDGSNVITNTAPNVVQTLSIAGQDLTLSNGGGTVAIPGGASDALGTGFTSGGGTGTIPDETIAKTKAFTLISDDDTGYNPTGVFSSLNFGGRYNDETFVFEEFPGFASFVSGVPASGTFSQFLFDGATKGMKFQGIGPLDRVNFTIAPGIFSFRYDNTSESYSLNFGGNGVQFRDDRAVVKGLEYRNYYENIENENNSLTSTQNVNSLKQKLVLYTEFERDAISSPVIGYILFCTDATADDSSTGVMQVWDGSTWKNAW